VLPPIDDGPQPAISCSRSSLLLDVKTLREVDVELTYGDTGFSYTCQGMRGCLVTSLMPRVAYLVVKRRIVWMESSPR
jgi:hypothetical protein